MFSITIKSNTTVVIWDNHRWNKFKKNRSFYSVKVSFGNISLSLKKEINDQ